MTSTAKGLRRRILEALDMQRRSVPLPRLASLVGIDADAPDFLDTVRTLRERGEIYAQNGRSYASAHRSETILGVLRMAGRGFGFVRPEGGGEDVHVPARYVADALDEDIVLVQLMRRRGPRGLVSGKILGVASRRERPIVGRAHTGTGFTWIQPDDPGLSDIQLLGAEHTQIVTGQKVAARLEPITLTSTLPTARFERVLGDPGDPDVAMAGLIHRYGLRDEFPAEAEDEADGLPEELDETTLAGRRNLREWTIVTIDPESAADIDDAVSFVPDESGGGIVGVHIADVSHYVAVGGGIDREAERRGTSVYLPGRVLHMLPRRLSKDLCSLRAGKDRPAVSVLVSVDRANTVRGVEITRSVIHSNAQLDYGSVHEVLSGEASEENPAAEFRGMLERLAAFAASLTAERIRSGALDFDLPEVEPVIGPDGRISEMKARERLPSHRLIEELMLLANRSVAEFLRKKRVPLLYRVHAAPDPARLKDVLDLAALTGNVVSLRGKSPRPQDIQKLVADLAESPQAELLQMLVIRSLPKALYQPGNIGHFGLAARDYTHFTSPIRRYPDLVVHRQLMRALDGAEPVYSEADLDDLGRITSESEQLAERAEREALRLLQAEYLSDHVGEVYQGVVSGALRSGLFITLFDILAEGFVRVEDLPSDAYRYSGTALRLTGRHSRQSHGFGDHVVVQIASADADTGYVDLLLLENRTSRKTRAARGGQGARSDAPTKARGDRSGRGQGHAQPSERKRRSRAKGSPPPSRRSRRQR